MIKAFKYFEKDKSKLRLMQDMASQLVQENKIKGTLCFSVHPLDFLSSSENTYNWRSCHALDGEFRAGNLSYMTDNVTFMVYLKGADNVYLKSFGEEVPWNSKKWRVLMHFSECNDMLFAGRQYPFSSQSGIDLALAIFKDLEDRMNPHNSWAFEDWSDSYIHEGTDQYGDSYRTSSRYLYAGAKFLDIKDVVVKGEGALNYNDVLDSTSYTKPFYAYRTRSRLFELKKKPIIIGKKVKCLHCGEEHISNAETMRCDNCEFEYGYEDNDSLGSCSCCGTRIWIDDAYGIEPYGDLVCDHCYTHECFICSCCNNVWYNSERKYLEDKDWVCPECYKEYRERIEEVDYGKGCVSQTGGHQ